MKVVLDTNVLISSIFFSGPPSQILEAWRKAEVQFVMSPDIIEEYFNISKASNYIDQRLARGQNDLRIVA